MNDTVCAACKQGLQQGEPTIPITRRTTMGAKNGSLLPQYKEPERETVHAACFDEQQHNYAG